MNSLRHGGCSNIRIMPGGSLDEYEELRAKYFRNYAVESEMAHQLVENVVNAHWFMSRCDRNLNEAQQRLYAGGRDAWQWTGEEHHRLQLFERYRTTGERSFARALSQLESFRRTRMTERRLERQAEMRLKEAEERRSVRGKAEVAAKKVAVKPVVVGRHQGSSAPVMSRWAGLSNGAWQGSEEVAAVE